MKVKVGDCVIMNGMSSPRLVVSSIHSGSGIATCFYYNLVTGLYVSLEINALCLVPIP